MDKQKLAKQIENQIYRYLKNTNLNPKQLIPGSIIRHNFGTRENPEYVELLLTKFFLGTKYALDFLNQPAVTGIIDDITYAIETDEREHADEPKMKIYAFIGMKEGGVQFLAKSQIDFDLIRSAPITLDHVLLAMKNAKMFQYNLDVSGEFTRIKNGKVHVSRSHWKYGYYLNDQSSVTLKFLSKIFKKNA